MGKSVPETDKKKRVLLCKRRQSGVTKRVAVVHERAARGCRTIIRRRLIRASRVTATPHESRKRSRTQQEIEHDNDTNSQVARHAPKRRVHDGRRETLFLGDSARRRARANGDASRASADDPQSEATPAGVDSIESTMQTAGLRLRPDFENGRMRGLHVIEIGSATLLKRNGLISGDVLLAVNGIAITSPAHAEAALRALSGAEEARVLIDRGGQERTLTVALDG